MPSIYLFMFLAGSLFPPFSKSKDVSSQVSNEHLRLMKPDSRVLKLGIRLCSQ